MLTEVECYGPYLLWLYLLWRYLLWPSTYLRLLLAIPHGEPSPGEAVISRQPQHERSVHRRSWVRVRVRVMVRVRVRVGVGVSVRVRG